MLSFSLLSTRRPHGAYVQIGKRDRNDRRSLLIEQFSLGTNTEESDAIVAALEGKSDGRVCIPRHENARYLSRKINHVTNYISLQPATDGERGTSTVKINSVDELVAQRTSSMGISAEVRMHWPSLPGLSKTISA